MTDHEHELVRTLIKTTRKVLETDGHVLPMCLVKTPDNRLIQFGLAYRTVEDKDAMANMLRERIEELKAVLVINVFEAYYKRIKPDEQEHELRKGLANDPKASECVGIVVENHKGCWTAFHPIVELTAGTKTFSQETTWSVNENEGRFINMMRKHH